MEDHSAVLPPRSPQVGRVGPTSPIDVNLIEDIEAGVVGRVSPVGGDETRADRLDVDGVKPSGSSQAEDEVHRAADVGLGVDLAAFVRVDGVLVAGELAAVEALVGVLRAESERLAASGCVSECVCEVQVVELDVGGPQAYGGCGIVVG